MVIEFLNKLYAEVMDEKLELNSKIQSIQIKIDENSKYIQKLKKSEEETIDVFSPRKQNRNIQNNIISLEKEQQILLQDLQKYNGQLLILKERLNEFENILRIAKQEEVHRNFMCREIEKNNIEQKELNLSSIVNSIIHKIELCTKFLDVDPVRCKLELNSLIKILYEILDSEEAKWRQ